MSQTTSDKPAPRFAPIQFAGAAVAILLLAGGGWWTFSQSLPRPENAGDFRPDSGGRRGGNNLFAPRNNAPRDPVTVMPSVVTVRDGDIVCSANKRNDASWNINVRFNGESLADRDAGRLMLAVRRVLDMRNPPAALKLTPEQKSALNAVPLEPLEFDASQFKQFVDLLNQSQKLAVNAPEMTPIKEQLKSAIAAIKDVDRAAVKAGYAERDAKLRSILSAAQIETLLGGRNNGNAPRDSNAPRDGNPPRDANAPGGDRAPAASPA